MGSRKSIDNVLTLVDARESEVVSPSTEKTALGVSYILVLFWTVTFISFFYYEFQRVVRIT